MTKDLRASARSWRSWAVIGVGFVLVLSACSSTDDTTTTTQAAAATTTTAAPETTTTTVAETTTTEEMVALDPIALKLGSILPQTAAPTPR